MRGRVPTAFDATTKPAKSTTMPATNVTANAVSFPSRPASVPLAERTSAPVAMSTLPPASIRGLLAARRAEVVAAGTRPRTTRPADHSAPTMITIAGTPEPTAARMRGVVPKSAFAVGKTSGSTGAFIGAITMAPVA